MRKAFMSLELLLVIGLAVAAVAAGAKIYTNIQNNMENIRFIQDLNSVVLNFKLQEKKFKGIPREDTGKLLYNSSLYSELENIIKPTTSQSWGYYTISLTAEDDQGYSSGALLIKINNGSYTNIETTEVKNAYYKTCLNAIMDYELSDTEIINQIGDKNDWCLLKDNVKIFTTP